MGWLGLARLAVRSTTYVACTLRLRHPDAPPFGQEKLIDDFMHQVRYARRCTLVAHAAARAARSVTHDVAR